jgi:oligoribonuclease
MDNLVWVDCEMTGLNLERDALIEVAALVTDKDLNVLGDGVDIIIKPPAESLLGMDPFVVDMHTSSGLLDELMGGVTLEEAEAAVLAYVRMYVPEAGKAPLAGNTIGTDRAFLARDLPAVESYVHYRNVDVSTLKELARRWFPRIMFCAPEKQGNHRALADVQESIEELRYYREALFVPEPGPDRVQLQSIAARFQGGLTGLSPTPPEE